MISRQPGMAGRKRSVNVREVLNGIFYILWTGCRSGRRCRGTCHRRAQCTIIWSTWNWDGTLERIHHALYHQWPYASRGRT